MAKDDMTRTPLKRCSFCGKTERQVMRMVAGANNVCICNECIMLCQEIISDAMPMMHSGHPQQEQKFDHLPSPAEMKQVLDDYVIGQEHAKRALCWRCTTITSASASAPARMMLNCRSRTS